MSFLCLFVMKHSIIELVYSLEELNRPKQRREILYRQVSKYWVFFNTGYSTYNGGLRAVQGTYLQQASNGSY